MDKERLRKLLACVSFSALLATGLTVGKVNKVWGGSG